MRPLYFTLLLFAFFFTEFSHAYTTTQTSSGAQIKWGQKQKYFLAGNPNSASNYPASNFWSGVVNALQQWKWASGDMMDFDYWQGTDSKYYKTGFSQDGYSTVFFASNSNEHPDSNVIGYTQVWFNSTTGELLEADTLLNDLNYDLTSKSSDTSSQSNSGWGVRPKVFVNNIITHEVGHALGLSHSTTINSSMLYVEYKEQAQLGCDDWAGMRELYNPPSSVTGVLTGRIISPQGDGVPGTAITAISKSRGIPLATVMSDQSGNFRFGALEPGSVSLMVQPYQGSSSSVPAQVQAKESTRSMCNGRSFPSFFATEADDHTLKEYGVPARGQANVGTLQLSCAPIVDSGTLFSNMYAPDLLVDTATSGTEKTYTFMSNGPFRITGIGYLLMSPITVNISVKDASGNAIKTEVLSPMYESDSTFRIADTQISGYAVGPIQVNVSPREQTLGSFPSPAVNPTSDRFFVITFNADGNRSPASTDLTNNARCSPPKSFANYQSPPGNPMMNPSGAVRNQLGFCGTVQNVDTKSGRNFRIGPPSGGAIFGWFFPFIIALAYHAMSIASRRRFLLTLKR